MITQLYQIGVYAIVNNNPKYQFSFNPKDIVKLEKRLQKDYDNGKIKDLIFGVPITVTTEDGLYIKCDE